LLSGQLPTSRPLYLRGNILTDLNYPFNERLAKLNRFLPRMNESTIV
jgi:hypothetical protein